MNRRKYIAALGSVAAGSAFAIGSSASIDIWADRETSIDVVRDTDGLISFSTEGSENSQFATTDGGTLGIDLSRASDAEGVTGFNVGARTTIDDIFRIRNQAGSDQVVWIKDTTDDGNDLLGDEGPLHFFRGPLRITSTENGALGARRRVFSQIDPVPGTPDAQQRLTITGLVPAQANISPDPSNTQRQAWINQGHPVTVVKADGPAITDEFRTNRFNNPTDSNNVFLDRGVVVGNSQGRYFLEPGEEMVVGIDADFRGFSLDGDDDLVGPDGTSYTDPLPDEIQIVSRGPDDARNLATGDTEFNTVPGTDEE
ncbi:hypothetical protein DP107_15900 [Haloglomus irregulare]|uniref:DUF1102 domain-containing protein n=1 Tax=Haloglomus irregulare TaxID=2234134 RepID=A0A554MW86_9EURY|nr:hypothetical protein [Haloglomus irregulare]TSD09392.1 hypothetical protein DP107_15900 [Haloglomus irregulare]